ncbi:MAG: hypothetical protein ACYCPQ_00870 [Elusimicrobiota bacterium]
MKKNVQFLFVLGVAVFSVIQAQAGADFESPDLAGPTAGLPMGTNSSMGGGIYSGVSPAAGDFMENYPAQTLPKFSGLAPAFAPTGVKLILSAPKTDLSAAEASPFQFSIPQSIVEPVGMSASGPPPRQAGSLEDFLANAQNSQPFDRGSGIAPIKGGANAAQNQKKQSLWQMLLRPLALPAAKADQSPAGEAAAMGREDYDSHILGSQTRPDANAQWAKRPSPVAESSIAAPPAAASPAAASVSAESNDVMVALNLDFKKHPGQLRDALADLSREAFFKPAAGFGPGLASHHIGSNGKISIVGWLPKNRVPNLFHVSSVAQVKVDWHPGPSARTDLLRAPGSYGDVAMGIRIPPGKDPASVLSRTVRRLGAESGFSYSKTIGYRALRGSTERMLMIVGRMPLRQISSAMADPGVLRLGPVPPPPAMRPAARRNRGLAGFFDFVMRRSPMLVGLTALALVFSLASV